MQHKEGTLEGFTAAYGLAARKEAQPQQILFSGFGGRKAPSSMGKISTLGVLRLRATSAVSREKSVRRCAQDDVFCRSFKEKHTQ
jgi:hypothetical protein